MNLLMNWAQFINNYLKSTLGRLMMKQFVLQLCFFYVLPRHTNTMTWHFIGGLDNHLEIMLYYYTYKFISGYLHFPNNLKDIKDHI